MLIVLIGIFIAGILLFTLHKKLKKKKDYEIKKAILLEKQRLELQLLDLKNKRHLLNNSDMDSLEEELRKQEMEEEKIREELAKIEERKAKSEKKEKELMDKIKKLDEKDEEVDYRDESIELLDVIDRGKWRCFETDTGNTSMYKLIRQRGLYPECLMYSDENNCANLIYKGNKYGENKERYKKDYAEGLEKCKNVKKYLPDKYKTSEDLCMHHDLELREKRCKDFEKNKSRIGRLEREELTELCKPETKEKFEKHWCNKAKKEINESAPLSQPKGTFINTLGSRHANELKRTDWRCVQAQHPKSYSRENDNGFYYVARQNKNDYECITNSSEGRTIADKKQCKFFKKKDCYMPYTKDQTSFIKSDKLESLFPLPIVPKKCGMKRDNFEKLPQWCKNSHKEINNNADIFDYKAEIKETIPKDLLPLISKDSWRCVKFNDYDIFVRQNKDREDAVECYSTDMGKTCHKNSDPRRSEIFCNNLNKQNLNLKKQNDISTVSCYSGDRNKHGFPSFQTNDNYWCKKAKDRITERLIGKYVNGN